MAPPLIVPFPGWKQAPVSQVGGKAASLIRMSGAGLPVPPGAVFTSAFFAPWFDKLRTAPAWTKLVDASIDDWAPLCCQLKNTALTLPLSAMQRDTLDSFVRDLAVKGSEARFAVRSSSPEEDLTSASFAGLYETRLGVRLDNLESAVRDCFASSLDARVLSYKRQHNFDVGSPAFAVIVQGQIDSEISGVGFSLNPMSNDYDEAVIDANWGLGASVVEGRVTPDHFVVNKITRRVVEETRGEKHLSIWLDPAGGTIERLNDCSAERGLTDGQLQELVGMICRIEALYGVPVDIEWTYAGAKLRALQSRLITAFFLAGGRMHVNYSNLLWLASPKTLSKSAAPTGELMAEILLGIDPAEYRSVTRPPWIGIRPPQNAFRLNLILLLRDRVFGIAS